MGRVKGKFGSKSDSAIGGVAAAPGPSITPVGNDCDCDCSSLSNELASVCEGPAVDSRNCLRVSTVMGTFAACDRSISVSGVAGTGSSMSSGVMPMCPVSAPRTDMRGLLLRRCRLAISAASRMDGGGGDSSAVSRFRRPDTVRIGCGFELRRVVRLGAANVAGPLKVSILRSLPFEARRLS